MGATPEKTLKEVALVEEAQTLLGGLLRLDASDRDVAAEMVLELQVLVDKLRRLHPPRTFRRQARLSSAPITV